MKIGCPTEIKPQEFRVGMTPNAAAEAVANGHSVLIETNAGAGSGFPDEDYRAAGAAIVDTAEEVFASADMIVKVKEPQAGERKMLREGQLLFTYLHLAPDPEQTKDLLASGCTAISRRGLSKGRNGGATIQRSASRFRRGANPARTSEDLPDPEAPKTISNRAPPKLAKRFRTSRPS